jgi:molybdopterin converting factor small subunit
MGHIGFWQLLLDDKVSVWEANKINQASDQAKAAQSVAGDAHIRVHALEERLSVQSREIVMLRTAVTVLTNTLRDCKILDERLLDARLEAAMEEAKESMAPKMRDSANLAKRPKDNRVVTCVVCRKSVPLSTTLMTGDGPSCERCPAT